jgi:GDP-L-fucose synthase
LPEALDLAAPFLIAAEESTVGGALRRALARRGHRHLLALPADLAALPGLFAAERPAYVVLSGPSGGIGANQRKPADLMRANLELDAAVFELAQRHGARKLLYLGSACMYPRECEQPMRVDALLTGPLEPTSEPYAIAKLAGMKLTEAYRKQHGCDFIAAIPSGVIGPDDHFDPEDSHVVGALLLKMHAAKSEGRGHVDLWGSGKARREFMAADDLAEACLQLMENYADPTPINIGSGVLVTIRDLAEQIKEVVGYRGLLQFDHSRPDGAPMKYLDSRPLRALGWTPRIDLRSALALAYSGLRQKHEAHGTRQAL